VSRQRILVVDDESEIGSMIQRMLRTHYEVVVETRATSAMARLMGTEWFDLILCDVMMFPVDGAEFYGACISLDARLARRFLFITGGAPAPRLQEFVSSTSCPVLMKPFDVAGLLRKVQDCLKTLEA
jgi:two-component system, cell cycle sensor histidine kinase and response regulator CckA